jgi:hypothetical protein
LVSGHGIDTVALAWRDDVAADGLLTIAQSGLTDAASGRRQRGVWQGRHLRLALPVAGITLGVYPGLGLVTADARVASMLAGHDGDSALVAPERLPQGVDRARAALASIGVCVVGPAVVRRLDLAGELWFPRASDGLMFLCACQRVLQLPRLAQRDYYARGEQRLESLVWQTPKGNQTRVRIYDSGAKRGTAEAGQRLRVERQCRWHGDRTQTTEQVLGADLSAMFCGPMRSWLVGAPMDIVMTGPSAAVAILLDRVRRGEIPRRRAEALIGKLTMLANGRDLLGAKDRQRREQDLRKAGIALDVSGDPRGGTVDLRSPLVALADLWGSA